MQYKMDDGSIVRTELAKYKWEEATYWNGNNHISVATGSQWDHETLYQSSKGRYWIERTSQRQGSPDRAHYITDREAALWILTNEGDLTEELAALEEEITE